MRVLKAQVTEAEKEASLLRKQLERRHSEAHAREVQDLRVALEEANETAREQRNTIDSLDTQLRQAHEQHKVRRLSHGMHSVSRARGADGYVTSLVTGARAGDGAGQG